VAGFSWLRIGTNGGNTIMYLQVQYNGRFLDYVNDHQVLKNEFASWTTI
jgi:hypothetical protein